MKNKILPTLIRALAPGGLLVCLASCSSSRMLETPAPPPPVVSVVVAPAAAAMPAGLGQAFGATVSGTASGSVTWSVTEGASGGTVNAAGYYVSPLAPGTFHLRATADASHYAEATVTVTPAITVGISPAATSLAPGASQAFSADVRNGTGTNVNWSAMGGTITESGFFTAGATPGTATVRATSQQDPSKSAEAVITIALPPQMPVITSFTASPAAITAGQDTTLAWVVENATGLAITPGVGSVSGSSRTVSPSATTTYTLGAANAVGTATATASVTVVKAPQPPVISAFAASPVTINLGQSTTLTWSVVGATVLSLDQGIGVVSGSSRGVTPSTTTTYLLSASNAAGATIATATVSVLQSPSILSFTVSPGSISAGQSATLAWVVSGAVSLSLNQGIGTVTGTSRTVSPSATTTYTLSAFNAAGTTTATALVTVMPAPQPPVISSFTASPAAINLGQSTTLAWSVAGATVLSLDQGIGVVTGSSRNVTPSATTTYLLSASNAAGTTTATATVSVLQPPSITSFTVSPGSITAGQSATLAWIVSGATSLSLNQGIGAVTGTSRTVSPSTTTTYTLSALNAAGSRTATASVTVVPAPQPPGISSFTATPATINLGQSATLAWSVAGATVLSLDQGIGVVAGTSRGVTPSTTTTYLLSASNPAGTTTATATVTVLQPPSIASFSASPGTIATGQSTTLNWTVNGATGLSLDQGIGAVVGSMQVVNPSLTTTYTLTASNAAGSVSASATVTVDTVAPPVISSFTASPASIPVGSSAALNWTVTGANSLSLDQGLGTVTGSGLNVAPGATTSYVLTASNVGGSATATATVTVTPLSPTANPILFVTQVPFDGFGTISMPFANHDGSIDSVPRGGDLWIRYADGSLRNLTQEAGFGLAGLQGANSIAVREPSVHWSGAKAVFAMVVGTGTQQYVWMTHYWQLYEVSGLGKGQTAVITKVPNQATDANNISPVYGTDERIIFASDRSRSGEHHLYPQLDEYESTATLTGLWSLDPASGDLTLLNHTPSGAFHPFVDSFGRVVFSKWDHLQRDQQADADNVGGTNGSFNYADETATAARNASRAEVFPEPRSDTDPENIANHANGHRFNQFFPWQLNEDGTEEETLNHVGRHEIGGYYLEEPAFTDDPNLSAYAPEAFHSNRNYLNGDGGIFSLREDPRNLGVFFATNMREFNGGRAGQIITLNGAVGTSPEAMNITWITDPATKNEVQPGDPTPPGATGRYRNPLPMSDGTLIAAHTSEVMPDTNLGDTANPNYRYQFRLKTLKQSGTYYVANQLLTPGFTKSVSWYNPDTLVSYNGPLWELDPVEVVARSKPARRTSALQTPELQVFSEVGVDETILRTWLRTNNLALIVSRDVTTRDRADVQQPLNLRVPGGVSTVPASGKVYDLAHLQIFQGDQVRGYGGTVAPRAGRRVLSKTMHGSAVANNPTNPGGPAGSVKVGLDGSTAAFVPAQRALTWQLTDGTGKAVVRERNWISFQAGEIRTCASCHGINSHSQTGAGAPQNKPEALRQLLTAWKAAH